MKWEQRALADCASFFSGGTPNKGRPEYWGGAIPWVSSGEMTSQFIKDTTLQITEEGLSAGSRLMPEGTIFTVVRGMSLATEFRVSYATAPMAFNQDLKALVAKEGIDPYFLFSALRSQATSIRDLATEAAHGTKKLEMERFQSFQILVPDLDTQIQVAKAIRNYDDLIENNQRRIALLEESAHLLYREWFLNLRFPGHESYPSVGGVPEGWARKSISDMVQINPKVAFEKDRIYPFVPMQALSECSMLIEDTEERAISGGAKFQNQDTLLARITPCLENGKTGFVQFLEEDKPVASGSTEFIVMRSESVSPYWVYCTARDEGFRKHAIGSMVGSDGRQRVNLKCFDSYFAFQPPENVLNDFDEKVEPMFKEIQLLSRMNQRLREARDALLPKLMSGEIQV
ncbi:restriction endonuclease subunit S [Parachitinimonas caeni]|uniref:Restriction endonuclease subunit S n=1 Tax=Parachitinimonas caeni TaxID=3031301 RepID=A0ABT7E3G5_9NEIS|nr:restriction endonuclease subunit S [Parachitinimonas caeni]MDK2126857.1 restriction endonuclease subunit S [Parachitinimonas caeni]